MRFLPNFPTMTFCAVSGALLAACGGGQTSSPASNTAAAAPPVTDTVLAAATFAITPKALPSAIAPLDPALPPSLQAANSVITDIVVESTLKTGAAQSGVPFTFGQVFAVGDLPTGKSVVGRLADGTTLPLQVDVKALHADGSVRHAIISGVMNSLAAAESRTVTLMRTSAPAAPAAATPNALLTTGFSAGVSVVINGQTYSATAESLLRGTYSNWLSGSSANEWLVSAPLRTTQGVAHPHLTARFAVREYGAVKKARVDVSIENDWAYEPNPQNFTYDAQISVGGKTVFTTTALTQAHHTRWRKMFWWGDTPQVHLRHNTKYLIASRAVPNYDNSIKIDEGSLKRYGDSLATGLFNPMQTGLATPYMPTTGGRIDIGLLPGWSVAYLLSMDKRAKDAMLGTADLAGSYSSHYRDRNTDNPVSLQDYPEMTLLGRSTDTLNLKTGKFEAFPGCAPGASCAINTSDDMAHQPGFAYLPYLVTGDYYYLEELLFWDMYNSFSSNPNYRDHEKGLFNSDQVRGQGWSMRTAAETAYITPDAHPLKKSATAILNNNIDWYTANYATNATANKLGIIVYGGDVENKPWADDFFTSAIGHAVELGFSKATTLLTYKALYPVGRMTAPNTCWIDAAAYVVNVRDTSTSPHYTSWEQVYRMNHSADFNKLACNSTEMAASLGLMVGEMTGYATTPIGYPSNMQPALAYSVAVGGAQAAAAWKTFMARPIKPDYTDNAQFAIVPR